MKFRTALLPLLAALSFATPAQANQADTDQLLDLIKQTGTKVSFNSNHYDKHCIGSTGYYAFEKDVEDLLVVCRDQVDLKDSDAVWEVVAHEATHIMQACLGGNVIKDEYVARMHRELRAQAPHYSRQVADYNAEDQLDETEAFWMELQEPAVVMGIFRNACFSEN